jgi:hypothetical protein
MLSLPTGTVTFLFTDIEGSTRLWQQHPEPMKSALARHHGLLQYAIESAGGYVFQIVGDTQHRHRPRSSSRGRDESDTKERIFVARDGRAVDQGGQSHHPLDPAFLLRPPHLWSLSSWAGAGERERDVMGLALFV